MKFVRFIPIIVVIGGLIGIYALISIWFGDLNGLDLVDTYPDDFHSYIPIIVTVISIIVIALAVLYMALGIWFFPFIMFFIGMAILLITSVFSMWTIGDIRVTTDAGMGLWLSYLAGTLMIVGFAIQFLVLFRKPQKT